MEIGREVAKNQRLTPFLFGQIFRAKIFNVISPKTHSNYCKTRLYGINFHIFSLFRKLEIGRKIVKKERRTPLLFGRVFRRKILEVISPKNHSNHCKTRLYPINVHIFSLFRKLEIGRKVVKNQRLTHLLFGEFFDLKNLFEFEAETSGRSDKVNNFA